MTGRCYTTFAKTILHVCSREGEKNILQKWTLKKANNGWIWYC